MSLNKILAFSISGLFILSCSQNVNNDQINQNLQTVDTFSTVKVAKPEWTYIASPNKNARPAGAKISTIVLHHTASKASANATGKFFTDPAAKVSAHYTVDRTGYIIQSVKDEEASWHAGKSSFNGVDNVNDFSIGIEICNVGDNTEPYPDTQYDSLIKLVAYLAKEHGVPVENITRHRDVCTPPGRKTDTSNNFSTSKVIDGVKASLRGNYNPEVKPFVPFNVPDVRTVALDKDMDFQDIADVYLDNEARANEIMLLNTKYKGIIPQNSSVRIPTDYKYFYELKNRK